MLETNHSDIIKAYMFMFSQLQQTDILNIARLLAQ